MIVRNGLCLSAFHFTQTGTVTPESMSCLDLLISTGALLPQHIFSGDLLPLFGVYVEEAYVRSAFFIKEIAVREGRQV